MGRDPCDGAARGRGEGGSVSPLKGSKTGFCIPTFHMGEWHQNFMK